MERDIKWNKEIEREREKEWEGGRERLRGTLWIKRLESDVKFVA